MFAGQEIKSKGGEAFGSGIAQPSGCWGGCQSSWPTNPKDIHSAGSKWQQPLAPALLWCPAWLPRGTHAGLSLQHQAIQGKTGRKPVPSVPECCGRGLVSSWVVGLRVTPSPLGAGSLINTAQLCCVLVLHPPDPQGGNVCSGFRAYKLDYVSEYLVSG